MSEGCGHDANRFCRNASGERISTCLECVRIDKLERDKANLLTALESALNYWEPPCQGEECDKGYHVEQLHAWQAAKATLAKAQS